VVDVGLLPRGDAAVDLGYESAIEQLEQDHPGPRVHDLLDGGAIRFVLDTVPKKWYVYK
jgi:hypothetical protein